MPEESCFVVEVGYQIKSAGILDLANAFTGGKVGVQTLHIINVNIALCCGIAVAMTEL